MNVIVYHGSSAAREVIRKYEWNYLDAKVSRVPHNGSTLIGVFFDTGG